MLLKNFNDFRSLISEEYISNMSKMVTDVKLETKIPIDQESANEFVGAICAANLHFTLQLLEKYHRWLSENRE